MGNTSPLRHVGLINNCFRIMRRIYSCSKTSRMPWEKLHWQGFVALRISQGNAGMKTQFGAGGSSSMTGTMPNRSDSTRAAEDRFVASTVRTLISRGCGMRFGTKRGLLARSIPRTGRIPRAYSLLQCPNVKSTVRINHRLVRSGGQTGPDAMRGGKIPAQIEC